MECVRKHSKKREAMLGLLRESRKHPSAELLYRELKPSFPELSLATVYRNLAVLAQQGEIISVGRVGGQERYDARTEPHSHFVCRVCGRVMDLELPGADGDAYGLLQRLGYRAESHALTITGLCPDCAAQSGNGGA